MIQSRKNCKKMAAHAEPQKYAEEMSFETIIFCMSEFSFEKMVIFN
jgi:hypothetical protein